MKVILHNYKDSQTVFTPVILVKGSIIAEEESESLDRDLTYQQQLLHATLCTYTAQEVGACRSPCPCDISNHTPVPLKIVKTEFVAVVELASGHNCLILYSNQIEIYRTTFVLVDESGGGPSSKYFVRSLIVHCIDSEYQDSIHLARLQTKVDLGLKLVQGVFSELVCKSFHVRSDKPTVVVTLGLTRDQLLKYSTFEVWEYLVGQIMGSPELWSSKCKYVAYILDPWNSRINSSKGEVDTFHPDVQGLGGGGLALLDAKFLTVWPERWNQVLDRMWNNSEIKVQNNSTSPLEGLVGPYFSKSLGGLIHEIGHIFDLGHAESGIMGSQYHHCNLIFAPFASVGGGSCSSNSRMGSSSSSFVLRPDNGGRTENLFSFTRSSLAILRNHRWFSPVTLALTPSTPPLEEVDKDIKLEHRNSTISSSWPLSVIELIDLETGFVFQSWVFDDQDKFTFKIGRRSIPEAYRTCEVQLVVQNTAGTLIKETIEPSSLPETYTQIKRPKWEFRDP